MNFISTFTIHKLYGKPQSIELEFKDNTLILVGENGAGKTTILKILFYTLSQQWKKLAMYNFLQIDITIKDKLFIINRDEIKSDISEKQLKGLPPSLRREITSIRLGESLFREGEFHRVEMLSNRYGIPITSILDILESQLNLSRPSKKSQTKFAEIQKELSEINILYLPTYRRIEEELNTIFRGIDEENLISRNRRYHELEKSHSGYTELIEFGMKDVERAIKKTLDSLKDFARESLNTLTLGYLGDVVDKKYTQVDLTQISEVSKETISNILNRIDTKILSNESKEHLYQTIDAIKRGGDEKLSEHDKVICHYFTKLLYFQQDLEYKETKINGFCDVCSKYMKNKTFEYDSTSFNFRIYAKSESAGEEIQLSQLSSGEKQIVSLFSHLYLSTQNNYLVLIDEPELSLSVKWQREFLIDIKNGDFCKGLIAVTHSPFIFENELRTYTHGIGEFYKELF